MRFKKGSKVEVLNIRESPYWSWWEAEIISGNGHYYNVIYDICPPHMGNEVVERVPRKLLRPIPPVLCINSWSSGDYVEVFRGGSWSNSVVKKVVDGHHCYVMIFGSPQTFKVHSFNVRPRQSWQDPNWVVVGKDCRNSDVPKLFRKGQRNKLSSQGLDGDKPYLNNLKVEPIPSANSGNHLEPQTIPFRGVKRSSEFLFPRGGNIKSTRRKIGTEGVADAGHQLAAETSSRLIDKVDAVVSQPMMLAEKYMHTPHNRSKHSQFYGGKKPNADIECLNTRRLEPYSADDDSSSACSSTGSNSSTMLGATGLEIDALTGNSQRIGVSKYVQGESNPQNVDMNAEIHKVELHAYRSTMGVLYASGPLSWEQETLMTNLRLMLHISNDEHLSELRHLISPH